MIYHTIILKRRQRLKGVLPPPEGVWRNIQKLWIIGTHLCTECWNVDRSFSIPQVEVAQPAALVWKSLSCSAESEIPVWREGLRSITNVRCPIFKNLSHFRVTIHVSKPIPKRHIEVALGRAASLIGDIASEQHHTEYSAGTQLETQGSEEQLNVYVLRVSTLTFTVTAVIHSLF